MRKLLIRLLIRLLKLEVSVSVYELIQNMYEKDLAEYELTDIGDRSIYCLGVVYGIKKAYNTVLDILRVV